MACRNEMHSSQREPYAAITVFPYKLTGFSIEPDIIQKIGSLKTGNMMISIDASKSGSI